MRLHLCNIGSQGDRYFTFRKGVNVIVGEYGSTMISIISGIRLIAAPDIDIQDSLPQNAKDGFVELALGRRTYMVRLERVNQSVRVSSASTIEQDPTVGNMAVIRKKNPLLSLEPNIIQEFIEGLSNTSSTRSDVDVQKRLSRDAMVRRSIAKEMRTIFRCGHHPARMIGRKITKAKRELKKTLRNQSFNAFPDAKYVVHLKNLEDSLSQIMHQLLIQWKRLEDTIVALDIQPLRERRKAARKSLKAKRLWKRVCRHDRLFLEYVNETQKCQYNPKKTCPVAKSHAGSLPAYTSRARTTEENAQRELDDANREFKDADQELREAENKINTERDTLEKIESVYKKESKVFLDAVAKLHALTKTESLKKRLLELEAEHYLLNLKNRSYDLAAQAEEEYRKKVRSVEQKISQLEKKYASRINRFTGSFNQTASRIFRAIGQQSPLSEVKIEKDFQITVRDKDGCESAREDIDKVDRHRIAALIAAHARAAYRPRFPVLAIEDGHTPLAIEPLANTLKRKVPYLIYMKHTSEEAPVAVTYPR